MFRSREKFDFHNSLVGVIGGLENVYTIIDLRNEAQVAGKITEVDGCMNLEMEDVVFYDSKGKEHEFETFYINSRNIRHIHIPKSLSPEELMERQKAKITRAPQQKSAHTFKKVRAKRYNQEILSETFKPSTSGTTGD